MGEFETQPWWVRLAARIVTKAILRSGLSAYEVGWQKGSPMMATKFSLAQVILRVFGGELVSVADLEGPPK